MRTRGGPALPAVVLVAASALLAGLDASAGQGMSRFVPAAGETGSAPENLCVAGDSLYFAADDGIHGKELWRIDAAGELHFVGDFRPGPEGSQPRSLVAVDGRLAFVGLRYDYRFAEVLEYVWQTAGTAAETRCVRVPLSAKPTPGDTTLVALGQSLYGAQTCRDAGRELFCFDPFAVWDTAPGSDAGIPGKQEFFAVLGNRLLFTVQASGVSSRNVWVLDTTAGPGRHKPELLTGAGRLGFSIFCQLAGGRLWFAGSAQDKGMELCVSDGTPEGTRLVQDIHAGTGDSNPKDFAAHQGLVYFQANDGVHGIELWRTDGTEAGTWMVKDINPGQWDSNPYNMRSIGKYLLFAATREDEGNELWRSDGTPEGTRLVMDLFPGPEGSDLYQPTVWKGLLFFAAEHPAYGEELWRSDGTPEGTRLVREINPGPADAEPYYLTVFQDRVYFAANDGVRGEEIWCSDGTAEGTVLAADIRAQTRIVRSGNPTELTAAGKAVFFAADDLRHGNELWWSDVETLETRMAADIRPGPEPSHPEDLVLFQEVLFFTADDGVHGRELWGCDAQGRVRLANDLLAGAAPSNPRLLTVSEADLFFVADAGAREDALYHLAGPEAAPKRIEAASFLIPGFHIERLRAWNGRLYLCGRVEDGPFRFAVLDLSDSRPEVLDFTLPEAVTWEAVRAAVPAGGGGAIRDATTRHLLHCYFSLPGMRGRSVWFEDRWFFTARTAKHGAELWCARGDVDSAALFYECCPGTASGSPGEFRIAGGELFFAAERLGRGRELWTTDGMAEGTRVVADWPGHAVTGAGPQHLVRHGNALFYSAPGSGWYGERRALTKCLRTPNGLFVTTAAEPGRHWPDNPAELISAGGWLYFAADHPATGRELWRYGEREGGFDGRAGKYTVYTLVRNAGHDRGYGLDAEITARTWRSAP